MWQPNKVADLLDQISANNGQPRLPIYLIHHGVITFHHSLLATIADDL
jgi:hypothetical protein